jgi:predicted nucleotide-binding protein
MQEKYADKELRVLTTIFEMSEGQAEKWILLDDLGRRLQMPQNELYPILKNLEERKGLIESINEAVWIIPAGIEELENQNAANSSSEISVGMESEIDARKVFVVHGRNWQARTALFNFLRAIGLHPLEWSEAVHATGKASPYVGEVLDKAFSIARAVVVLFTPDDEARLLESFRNPGDENYEIELTPQARPNVLFEAGMAMGRNPDRTILIELGKLRPFSDIGGRHTIRLNNSTAKRQDLAQRLENAGCTVNTRGTDWHTEGDFESALISQPQIKNSNEFDYNSNSDKDNLRDEAAEETFKEKIVSNPTVRKFKALAETEKYNAFRSDWLNSHESLEQVIKEVEEIFSLFEQHFASDTEAFDTLNIKFHKEKNLRLISNSKFGCQIELKGYEETFSHNNSPRNLYLEIILFKKIQTQQAGIFTTDLIARTTLKPDISKEKEIYWRFEGDDRGKLTAKDVSEECFDLLIAQIQKKPPLDETAQGGRYIVDGVEVNSSNEPV